MRESRTSRPRSESLNRGRLTFRDATMSCCRSRAFSAMSCRRERVRSFRKPATNGRGRTDSYSKLLALTTTRVTCARIRRPKLETTTSHFCSKSGNRSSLAKHEKFSDHAAEEGSSQHTMDYSLHPSSFETKQTKERSSNLA